MHELNIKINDGVKFMQLKVFSLTEKGKCLRFMNYLWTEFLFLGKLCR